MKINLINELKNNGGFTVNSSITEKICTGFVCAKKGFEVQIPLSKINNNNINNFMSRNENVFCQYPEAKFGGWVNDGIVYLDISFVYESFETAILLAKEQGEKAIFNLATFEEIFVA